MRKTLAESEGEKPPRCAQNTDWGRGRRHPTARETPRTERRLGVHEEPAREPGIARVGLCTRHTARGKRDDTRANEPPRSKCRPGSYETPHVRHQQWERSRHAKDTKSGTRDAACETHFARDFSRKPRPRGRAQDAVSEMPPTRCWPSVFATRRARCW